MEQSEIRVLDVTKLWGPSAMIDSPFGMMKRIYFILAMCFCIQLVLATTWFASGIGSGSKETGNLKFIAWAGSLILAVVFLAAWSRKKEQETRGKDK